MNITSAAPTDNHLSPPQELQLRPRLRATLLRHHGYWLRGPLTAIMARYRTRIHDPGAEQARVLAAFNDDLRQLAQVVAITATSEAECHPAATRHVLGQIVWDALRAELDGKPLPWEETAA